MFVSFFSKFLIIAQFFTFSNLGIDVIFARRTPPRTWVEERDKANVSSLCLLLPKGIVAFNNVANSILLTILLLIPSTLIGIDAG